nr:PAAR domain-containing protein [Pseudophaeobacter leonis]
MAVGSNTVYVNGKQIGRIGDPVDCGSAVAVGSGDVFAGG